MHFLCRYVGLRPCISRLPENGYGANLTSLPARLYHPPDRLLTIKMDADISRKDIFRAETSYWNEVIDSYVRAFHWRAFRLRNVMDMRAGFGGYRLHIHIYTDFLNKKIIKETIKHMPRGQRQVRNICSIKDFDFVDVACSYGVFL